MTALLLCIEEPRFQAHARLGIVDGAPRTLECLRVLAPLVESELRGITANPLVPVHAHAADGTEGTDMQAVSLDDPRLLDQLGKAFRARGCVTRLLPRRQSDAWLLLREVPLGADVREAMSMALGAMSEDELEAMIAMLEDGRRQLAELQRKAAADAEAADRRSAEAISAAVDDAKRHASGS